MSADDDTDELRDMLMQTLEKNGTLATLRAQLRASVFLALEEQEKVKNKTPLLNDKVFKFIQTNDGRLCCELVIDFLKMLNLNAAESVFRPEINLKDIRSRDDLAKAVGVQMNVENSSQPVLAILLQSHSRIQNSKSSTKPDSFNKGVELPAPKSNTNLANNSKIQSKNGSKSIDFEDEQFRSVGDEDDFFGEKKVASPAGFSTITQRSKSQEKENAPTSKPSTASSDKKSSNTTPTASAFDAFNPKLSGSGSSLLGDLPELGAGRKSSGLPPLLGESKKSAIESNVVKQQNLMKILGGGDAGGSFEDFENDTPRSNDGSPKSPDAVGSAVSRPKLGNIGKSGKQDESPGKSKESSVDKKSVDLFRNRSDHDDDEISEEIVEDLDVDDLLSSARSEQRSF